MILTRPNQGNKQYVPLPSAIQARINCCEEGKPIHNGIPHHGIFFIKACATLVALGVGPGIMLVCFRNALQTGVLVFGLNSIFTTTMLIVAVLILRRLERGLDPMLDFDGRKAIL